MCSRINSTQIYTGGMFLADPLVLVYVQELSLNPKPILIIKSKAAAWTWTQFQPPYLSKSQFIRSTTQKPVLKKPLYIFSTATVYCHGQKGSRDSK